MNTQTKSLPVKFILLLSIFLAFAPAAQARKVETLNSILAKNRAADGPVNPLSGHDGYQVVYNVKAGGLTGTISVISAPPHRSRSEVTLGPIHEVDVDDGADSWQQDSTGNVRTVNGDELNENRMAESFSIETYNPLHDRKKGKVALRPAREPGTGCYIIDFTPNGGTLQTIYIDPNTFLARKIVARKAGIAATITVLAYKSIYGSNVPAHLEIGYGGLPFVVDANLSTLKKLAAIDPVLFQRPSNGKDYAFLAKEGADELTIPFGDTGPEIVMPVQINGKSVRMILDSGAGSSFITAAAAKRVGLKAKGSLPSLGYGGIAKTGIATETTMEISNALQINKLPVYVINDTKTAAQLLSKGGIEGALGYDVFIRFVVRIDYPKRTVTFLDPKSPGAMLPDPDYATILPIRLDGRTPSIEAGIDGQTGRFLVDTGDTGAVHLYTQFAEAHNLMNDPADPKAHTELMSGVGGEVREVTTDNHSLLLGRLIASHVPVSTTASSGITDISEHAGGIGNDVLKSYIAKFDYGKQQLTLIKPDELPTKPTRSYHHTGISNSSSFLSGGPFALSADFNRQDEIATDAGNRPADTRTDDGNRRDELVGPSNIQPVALAAGLRTQITLDTLLERHLAALGGRDAVARITSTRMVAAIETGGIRGTIVTVFAAPDREYEMDKLDLLDITQGYDGKVAWRQDTNGNIRLLAGNELKALRDQVYLDTVAYAIPGRIHGKLTLRATREAITNNYILDAEPDGGTPLNLFIDPTTYLIVKETHKDDNVMVTTKYDRYIMIDGVQFPMHEHISTGNPRYDTDVRVTKVENNNNVQISLFRPPHNTGKFSFVKQGATSATIPFDLDSGEIAIAVKIDGRAEKMFFDTGASGIAISKRVTDALKLKDSGYLEARGYGGSTDLHPVMLDTFDVGGAIVLHKVAAAALPLPQTLDPYLKRPLAGFVGYDLLAHFVIQIDFQKRQMTFIDPAAFVPKKSDGISLDLDLEDDIPAVTAQLDDLKPARFLLDTGDSGMLRLYGPYVTQNDLMAKYPHTVASVGGGIAGLSHSRRTHARSFTLAGLTFTDIPTDFSLDTAGGASLLSAGSIGSGLLSRYIMTFDYPHNRAYFAPIAAATAPFTGK